MAAETIIAAQVISTRTHPIVHQLLRKYDWRIPAIAVGLFVTVSLVTGLWLLVIPLVLLIGLLGAASYFVFEYGIRNLAIEVWDAGDHLQIERRGSIERIPLSHLQEACYLGHRNPPQVRLRLRIPCRWGTEINFLPDISSGRDHSRRAIKVLQQRIDRARPA